MNRTKGSSEKTKRTRRSGSEKWKVTMFKQEKEKEMEKEKGKDKEEIPRTGKLPFLKANMIFWRSCCNLSPWIAAANQIHNHITLNYFLDIQVYIKWDNIYYIITTNMSDDKMSGPWKPAWLSCWESASQLSLVDPKISTLPWPTLAKPLGGSKEKRNIAREQRYMCSTRERSHGSLSSSFSKTVTTWWMSSFAAPTWSKKCDIRK